MLAIHAIFTWDLNPPGALHEPDIVFNGIPLPGLFAVEGSGSLLFGLCIAAALPFSLVKSPALGMHTQIAAFSPLPPIQ